MRRRHAHQAHDRHMKQRYGTGGEIEVAPLQQENVMNEFSDVTGTRARNGAPAAALGVTGRSGSTAVRSGRSRSD